MSVPKHNHVQIRGVKDNGLNFAQEGGSGVQTKNADTYKGGVSMIQSKRSTPKSILRIRYNDPQMKQEEATEAMYPLWGRAWTLSLSRHLR